MKQGLWTNRVTEKFLQHFQLIPASAILKNSTAVLFPGDLTAGILRKCRLENVRGKNVCSAEDTQSVCAYNRINE